MWGMLLTGMSSVPVAIGIIEAIRSVRQVTEQQATGLGVVLGGVAETYSVFGLTLTFLLPLAAVIFLAKSFAEEKRARAALSIICICWGALMMAIPAWVMWFTIAQRAEH